MWCNRFLVIYSIEIAHNILTFHHSLVLCSVRHLPIHCCMLTIRFLVSCNVLAEFVVIQFYVVAGCPNCPTVSNQSCLSSTIYIYRNTSLYFDLSFQLPVDLPCFSFLLLLYFSIRRHNSSLRFNMFLWKSESLGRHNIYRMGHKIKHRDQMKKMHLNLN